MSFQLDNEFVESYAKRPVNWGFPCGGGNTFGEITWITKYSRLIFDPELGRERKEKFYEGCRRVIEGMYSAQMDFCLAHRTPWEYTKALRSAEEAFERLFLGKWSPPGRGWWMMGSEFVANNGSAALQNCAFLSTKNLAINATKPFVLLMEMSMLGIGVGFDTRGVGQVSIKDKSDRPARTYVVKDSREGWCKSLELLLERFFVTGHRVRFDYSLVRDAGQPIKGFGGQSAGPEPLKKLHNQIIALFSERAGELITELDILDVNNMIGKCVVSANVRSSAEIALSEQHGQDFMDAKNWEVYPDRNGPDGWGYTSNNSLIAKVGDDYTNVAESVADKGEPGLFYLDLARAYGRMVDPPTWEDKLVDGCNPCGEQPLEDMELCTLAETYPMNCDDKADFIRTLKFAFLYGKTVTLVPTHWPEVNQVMQRNRRIGTSLTGAALFVERNGYSALREWCNEGYAALQDWDHQYSRWLGIRESIKKSTIKPGGTVPLLIARPGLMGNPPGAHWPRASGAYIRTMRSSVNEPIIKVMEEAGYLIEPNFSNPIHGRVITLPVMGEEMRSEEDVPLWEKVELAKLLQRYWSDNSVSATFSFMPDEADQVASIIHVSEGQLKSLSFLPIDNTTYPQMPYQTIEREKWDEYSATIKLINWDVLYYGEDARDALGELYCTTDACEIKELM